MLLLPQQYLHCGPSHTPTIASERVSLILDYQAAANRIWPEHNLIKVEITNDRLTAYHSFFNKFAFDYWSPGRLVSQWIGANRERLHHAHIIGVVNGVGEYTDGCWYAVK